MVFFIFAIALMAIGVVIKAIGVWKKASGEPHLNIIKTADNIFDAGVVALCLPLLIAMGVALMHW